MPTSGALTTKRPDSAVRAEATGSGVNIESRMGEETLSIVRYLNADEQSFNKQKTSKNGLFVIVNPVLPEKFDAYYDGERVNENEGTVGNTSNAIFTVTISVDMPQG